MGVAAMNPYQIRTFPSADSPRLSLEEIADRFGKCVELADGRAASAILRITREQSRLREKENVSVLFKRGALAWIFAAMMLAMFVLPVLFTGRFLALPWTIMLPFGILVLALYRPKPSRVVTQEQAQIHELAGLALARLAAGGVHRRLDGEERATLAEIERSMPFLAEKLRSLEASV